MQKRRLFIPLGSAFLLHVLWLALDNSPVWIRDHICYNAIWIAALILALQAPIAIDRIGVATLALAIFSWGIGSLIAGITEFGNASSYLSATSTICYLAFYPLALIAIPRLIGARRRLRSVEVLDSIIFSLGFTSMVASIVLTTIFTSTDSFDQFLQILYPLGDCAILITLVITSATSHLGKRGRILLAATVIFALSDLYYLYLDMRHQYLFSQVIDDGWLLAVILLVVALYSPAPQVVTERAIHPALIAVAIFLSPVLLAISALRPGVVPIYVVIISIANLMLAFLRMSGAIHEARAIHSERELARTDELTGLSNRRRMMSEIDNFAQVEGALLLMDLDEFKPVNDLYGHEIGDQLLREVAKRLSKSLPEGDLLARLGGDEFGALIHGDYECTIEVAHALAATVSYPFRIKGRLISVGVSIGHVFNDGQGRLLERADLAMYEAKRSDDSVKSSSLASRVYQP